MLLASTKLEAINTMLSVIGESPVNTLDDNGVVDAVMARNILEGVDREVQSRGWHWNTEDTYSLAPTFPDGELILPANTLRVDTVYPHQDIDVVQRGLRLYDRTNHTYQFTKALRVDLVVALAWENMPEAARRYITIRAARTFQDNVVGSETLSRFTQRDELRALAVLMDAEAETADLNVLTGNYSVYRVLDR